MLHSFIKAIDRGLSWAELWSLRLARFGCLLLLGAIGLITVNVFARSVFGHSLLPAAEISGYILAASTSVALAYAQLAKSHIRIDAAYHFFPKCLQRTLDIVALIAFLVFAVLITEAAWGVAAESIQRGSLSNTPLQVPLWIPQCLWVAGMLWFNVVLALLLVRTLLAAVQGDMGMIRHLAGNETEVEDISKELS